MDHETKEHEERSGIEPVQQQFPSHVQAYDILRRIGELEDAKQSITLEIDECMGQLQAIAQHIDEDSLLNRMLTAVFPKVVKPKPAAPKRKTSKRKKR